MSSRIIPVLLTLLLLSACGGKSGNFQSTSLPEFQIDGAAYIQLRPPVDMVRTQSQDHIRLKNTGDGTLKILKLDWVDKPDRLVSIGAGSGMCSSDADCDSGSICITTSKTCAPTGLPSAPFTIGPQLSKDLNFVITPGGNELNCPTPGPDVPADYVDGYCGSIHVETNAENTNDPVNKGKATIYFIASTASGEIAVDPSYIEFTNVQPGSTASQDFSVQNNGMNDLTIKTMAVEDNPTFFTITNNDGKNFPVTVPSGTAASFKLTVTIPDGQMDYETFTTLDIQSSAGETKVAVNVTANAGSSPKISLDQDVLRFDSAADQTLTVSNDGMATLQITGISFSPSTLDPFYTWTVDGNNTTPINIPKGESKQLVVHFNRPSGNMDSAVGQLKIAHNDRNQGFETDVTLLGDAGDVPFAEIVPSTFTFLAKDGNMETRQFAIRNIGTADLTINNVTFGGFANAGSDAEFSISGVTGTVAPGAMVSGTVTFTGSNATSDQGSATLDSNNPTPLNLLVRALSSSYDQPTLAIDATPSSPHTGAPVQLSAANSMPSDILANAIWAIVKRPSGSATWLNSVGDSATFTPDVAGTYTVALTLLNTDREAQVTKDITVQ